MLDLQPIGIGQLSLGCNVMGREHFFEKLLESDSKNKVSPRNKCIPVI